MRGRQVFFESLKAHGVDAIFGNPGTTENPLLDTLHAYPEIPYYVALQESIAMSAASFYAAATNRPSVVNLHVAPGLGNAIGMMFGALKACSPVLVTAGQQDTAMRLREPILSYDLVEMAKPVTKWAAEPRTADELGPVLARAFKVAMTPPRGPVFVSLPVNVMSDETTIEAYSVNASFLPAPASDGDVQRMAKLLREAQNPAIISGDDVSAFGGFDAMVRIAEQTGAAVFQEGIRVHNNFPTMHPNFQGRLPFHASAMQKVLAPFDVLLLAGGQFFEEIWFDDTPFFTPDTTVIQIENAAHRLGFATNVDHGIVGHVGETLEALANQLDAVSGADARNASLAAAHAESRAQVKKSLQAGWDAVPMTGARAAHELAQALPDNAVIVDESITNTNEVLNHIERSRPFTYFGGRGGGIGQGIAGVTGAAAAFPDQPIVCLSGDGSAMYAIQALWTAAHHDLPILFVIWANREYRVLKHNLDIYRQRYDAASNNPYPHMDLDGPVIDFVTVARGHGVDGQLIEDPQEIGAAVQAAIASGKPTLLEIVIAGKPDG